MKKNILLTCPPMLLSKDQFIDKYEKFFNFICPDVVQTLPEDDLIQLLKNCEGWVAGDDPISEKVLSNAKSLKIIIKWGVGTDNVDFNAAKKISIKVLNTPNMFGNEVSDVALGYLLMISRKLHIINNEVKRGNWLKIQGQSLQGKVAGVVGLGDIGSNLAKKLNALGLNVMGYDPKIEKLDGVELKPWAHDIDLCDFLFFTCPLNEMTRNMFSENELKMTKNSLSIINVSRGGIIDEKAVIDYLKLNKLDYFASDVFEMEPLSKDSYFAKSDKVIVGSHNASNTFGAAKKTNIKALELLKEYFEKE